MRRSPSLLVIVLVAALSVLGLPPAAQADPGAISGAIQFPAGMTPPDIDPGTPDIAVFDGGDDEVHYDVLAYHANTSGGTGIQAALSWDVDSSQLRWTLLNPPDSTYYFTVFRSHWVYDNGPIPHKTDTKQFFLSSSSSSMATDINQATSYAVGTTGIFHCASGFEGCTAGGGGNSPAVTAGTPTIGGTARVGEELTASPGSWAPGAAQLAYQWLRDGNPISGATATTYVANATDAGRKLSVRVTGSLTGYVSQSATSASTSAVARGVLTTATPKVTGSAKVGKKLTAKPGKWGPAGVVLSYQWYADGQKIAKATKASYTIAASVKGDKIVVKVTGTLSGYTIVTKASKATGKVKG
jgi:hypothetical protein